MNLTCQKCGSRLPEPGEGCPACLLLGALDEPASPGGGDSGTEAGERRISGYEIVRKIGAGGSADVYLARQAEPIEREVALKLIRPGANMDRVVARFEAEREVLAKLRHPRIASIYDAGETAGGLPYFVMEYVEGVPVTDFVEREKLSLERRLRLFTQICEAVTHAHQRGVVHRDLKPSNLLVDAAGEPKVIDFGIARALEDGERGRTLFLTREGEMLGTPAYMSPEQALGQMAEIDTRSDVFSLGVVLYELLTGLLPVDVGQLREASALELRRILSETEFERPSLRETTTHIPGGAIRGDLDWIVMKALERDKERRYGSVAGLVEDIGRHLADEPVSAGPPTVGYRLQKFVRRHRAVVAGASVAAVALLAGTAVSVSQARRAGKAEADAVAKAETATEALRVSEAIHQFFVGDLLGTNLRSEVRPDVTLRELVDDAAAKVEARFAEYPKVAVQVEQKIGALYDALGEYEKSAERFLRAREHLDPMPESQWRDLTTLLVVRSLAMNAGRQGRTEEEHAYWAEWEALASRLDLPASDLLLGRSQAALVFGDEGNSEEVVKRLRALLPEFEQQFGEDDPKALVVKVNLGRHLSALGENEDALELLEAYVEGMRPRGETVALAEGMANLGTVYTKLGRGDEGTKTLEAAVAMTDELVGMGHKSGVFTRLLLADHYLLTGRRQEAVAMYRKLFEHSMQTGETLPIEGLAVAANYGGQILRSSPGKAKEVLEMVLRGLEEHGATRAPMRFQAGVNLGFALWLNGEKEAALAHLNGEVASALKRGGESNPEAQEIRFHLASLELERGRREAALPYLRAAVSAPRPEGEVGRHHAKQGVEGCLAHAEAAFADRPTVVVELYQSALRCGYTGDEVWRGLGMALWRRHADRSDLTDLRLAAISLLRAGAVNDATGVRAVNAWIGSDALADGLDPVAFLVGSETEWRYRAATPADAGWRVGGFDDGTWPKGRGEFGYGDGDEVTELERGAVSACFRLELTLDEAFDAPLVASIVFDDGALVHVGGDEVVRVMLPAGGEVWADTPAVGSKSREAQPYGFALDPALFPAGEPVVIAVQVHQSPHEAEDLSFAFELSEPMPEFSDVLGRLPAEEIEGFFGESVAALRAGPGRQ